MPTIPIVVQGIQYNQMMNDINVLLHHLIVEDEFEFEHLDVAVNGLTPRMKVNLHEQLNMLIQNLLGDDHPMIVKNTVNTIILSLDAAIYALFGVRNKGTFTASEIQTYLYKHLEWLFDVKQHYPSLLGNYITIVD